MRIISRLLIVIFFSSFGAGCSSFTVTSVKEIGSINSLDWPESICVDNERNSIYISNIETNDFGTWTDDGEGFITAVVNDGNLTRERWVDSRPWNILNAPKGMCVKDNILYVADNTRLLYWPLKMPDPAHVINIPNAKTLNDITTDGTFIYVSDTERQLIYKLKNNRLILSIKAMKGVNGLACFEDKLFAVSISNGEIYEIDKNNNQKPKPVGLSKYFKGLDGIEFFEDGSSVVTDLLGHKLFSINADMDEVIKLADIKWPADLGVDKINKIIYVPKLKNRQVIIFKY